MAVKGFPTSEEQMGTPEPQQNGPFTWTLVHEIAGWDSQSFRHGGRWLQGTLETVMHLRAVNAIAWLALCSVRC